MTGAATPAAPSPEGPSSGAFEIETLPSTDPAACSLRVRIPEELRYLEGHFPGDPIVPGIAQLLPLVHDPARRAWPDLGRLVAVRRLKFLDALRPGQRLEVSLVREGTRVRFEIRKGEIVASRGVLAFE